MIPILDFALRRMVPDDTLSSVRDLSTAVTLISVLSLLVARIAAERAEMQQVTSTTRLLADVLEQAQDLILVLTPEGRCRYANGAFCQAMGLTPGDLRKRRAGDLMTLEAMTSQDLLSHVRATGGWRGTVTRKRADGSTFPVSAMWAALVDERGTLTHIVSVERDISEERRLREQLIHSERLSAVGQLVAGVAHEINNPLQAVMGLSELLIEGHDSGDQRHDLDQIRVHADRAAKIVRHLLLFARHSALERSIADLNEVARSVVALRSYELKNLGIELVEHYSLDLPMTVINREEIQQVILNLLMNAEHAVLGSGHPGVGAHPHWRSGRLRVRRSAGQRSGRAAGRGQPGLRTVLHDEGRRAGHGSRPVRQPRHRRSARRHARTQAKRPRSVLPADDPAIVGHAPRSDGPSDVGLAEVRSHKVQSSK